MLSHGCLLRTLECTALQSLQHRTQDCLLSGLYTIFFAELSVVRAEFAIVDEAYPYVAQRLLCDDDPRLQEALRYMVRF